MAWEELDLKFEISKISDFLKHWHNVQSTTMHNMYVSASWLSLRRLCVEKVFNPKKTNNNKNNKIAEV